MQLGKPLRHKIVPAGDERQARCLGDDDGVLRSETYGEQKDGDAAKHQSQIGRRAAAAGEAAASTCGIGAARSIWLEGVYSKSAAVIAM